MSFPADGQADNIINSYTSVDGDYEVQSQNRLIVNDTLIVHGNLTVGAQAELVLNAGAVCIIYGNLDLKNKVDLAIGAHLIVGGDLTSANDKNTVTIEPSSAIYVLGTVSGLVDEFSCDNPSLYSPHMDDPCNYGDIISMEDNENSDDGIYDLFVSGDVNKGVMPVYSNLCAGPIVISALYETADSYQWCDSIGNDIPGETTYQFVPTEPGEYFVKITDGVETTLSHRAKVVISSESGDPLLQSDTPSIMASLNPACEGENITLSISGNLNDASHWAIYTGSCGGTLIGTTTESTYDLGALNSSATYYVRGEGGCVSPGACGTLSVTLHSLPDVEASASSTSICVGESVILTGTGANSYAWDNGAVNGIPFMPITTSTYTVTGTDVNGCSNTDQITVTVNAAAEIVLNSTATETCFGETNAQFEYSSTTGSPDKYSIDYNTTAEDEGFVDVADDDLPVNIIQLTVPPVASPGTYQAQLTVVNSGVDCGSVNYDISIIIHPLPDTSEILTD